MKRITTLAVLLGLVGSATASTIANWRFEEGVNGVEHAGDWDNFYQDSSGNGNHMSSWHDGVRPAGTSDRPFTTVPQTGAANNLALDFVGDEIGTFEGTKAINSLSFSSGWSIEASFKLNVLDLHQGIIVKEGDNTRGEAPFWMKILPWNNHVEVLFFDDNDNMRILQSDAPVVAGEWYSVAATYDNAEAKLYLKGESDAAYILQALGTLTFSGGASLDRIASNWFVGRSSWWGGPVDAINGSIDEIRISNIAIDPSKFIGILGASAPAIGNVGVEYLGASGLALTWVTSDLYTYNLLKTTTLTPANWTTNQTVDGGASSVTVTTAVDSVEAFYKAESGSPK